MRQDEEPVSFDLIHSDPRFVRYPLNLRTTDRAVHDDWLVEIVATTPPTLVSI